MFYKFPTDFLWGAATAALQIEGAPNADGAGRTTWQTLCGKAGAIANDDTIDVACDHYHRWKEDIQLIKALGVKAYRFSVNWTRIFPEGDGAANPAGVDFYSRLVDELLASGIQPFMTLFHWETPQSLEDRFGGWRSKEVSRRFGDFAAFIAGRYSDRVKHFFTMNEIGSFVSGYDVNRTFPPRTNGPRREWRQAMHNAVLAHGLAVQALRANGAPGIRVGIAQNPMPAVPLYETADNIEAARRTFREINAPATTLLMEGKYTEKYRQEAGDEMPQYTEEELAAIASPMDFLGLNIYTALPVISRDGQDITLPVQPGHPQCGTGWLKFFPENIYWTTRFASELWHVPEMYIVENGCAAEDRLSYPDGEVYDTTRILYLRQSLISLHRAISEGYAVKGYFPWSLLDNFEWCSGYSQRFGLYYVDYHTQKRTLKASGKFYRETVRNNALA